MKDFFAAVKDRRTHYGISRVSPVSDDRIKEIVRFAVKHVPSAFNSQSGRAVLLLGKSNDEFWSMVKESLRKIVLGQVRPHGGKGWFRKRHGTVLFFEDSTPRLKKKPQSIHTYRSFPHVVRPFIGDAAVYRWGGWIRGIRGLPAALRSRCRRRCRKKWPPRRVALCPDALRRSRRRPRYGFLPLEDRVWIRE